MNIRLVLLSLFFCGQVTGSGCCFFHHEGTNPGGGTLPVYVGATALASSSLLLIDAGKGAPKKVKTYGYIGLLASVITLKGMILFTCPNLDKQEYEKKFKEKRRLEKNGKTSDDIAVRQLVDIPRLRLLICFENHHSSVLIKQV